MNFTSRNPIYSKVIIEINVHIFSGDRVIEINVHIFSGDRVIEINARRMEGLSRGEAVEWLKSCDLATFVLERFSQTKNHQMTQQQPV